jgi:hypothetical protein
MLPRRVVATAGAVTLLTVPSLARAEIINPGAMLAGYLFSTWGVAAMLVFGWRALGR